MGVSICCLFSGPLLIRPYQINLLLLGRTRLRSIWSVGREKNKNIIKIITEIVTINVFIQLGITLHCLDGKLYEFCLILHPVAFKNQKSRPSEGHVASS